MLRPKRRNRFSEFSIRHNAPTVLLLGALFACGLAISIQSGIPAVTAYLLLWGLSYLVIFAGTCRYCAYYGKKCPIPLEGSCVDRIFARKAGKFGYWQLSWATAAYGMRVLVPFWTIFQHRLVGWGIAFGAILAVFWLVHLRVTGCPNCINTDCPLNPDHSSGFRLDSRRNHGSGKISALLFSSGFPLLV